MILLRKMIFMGPRGDVSWKRLKDWEKKFHVSINGLSGPMPPINIIFVLNFKYLISNSHTFFGNSEIKPS
jgi:hypothetical protein